MKKRNKFVKFLKKINLSINSLLENYLNKLKFKNFTKIIQSNKVLWSFVALIILFLSYLLVPHIHNKSVIKSEFENQFYNKFGLTLISSNDYKYKFFPRPHFIIKNISFTENQKVITKIENLYIYVSLNNFFSLKKLTIKDLKIEKANFNLDKENYNFFIKLFDKNYQKNIIKIKDSKIFFRNKNEEVLFINKIKKMKFFYDKKELRNVVESENEIFNIPYTFSLFRGKGKKVFSKIDLNLMNIHIKNEFNYSENIKKGLLNFNYNKKKSIANYEISKNSFDIKFYDKVKDPNFNYRANINFNPFFSNIKGNAKKIDLSSIFNFNGLFAQLIKTKILNHENLNFEIKVNADNIKHYKNFVDIILFSKIQEGLIDVDDTEFNWKNYANFKLSETLIYEIDNELILDGKLAIDIIDLSEIYKIMLTPKNYRLKMEKISLNIRYNFDQKIMNLQNIKIDKQTNKKVNLTLKNILFKSDKLQNKIYIKNIFNEAIKAYAG